MRLAQQSCNVPGEQGFRRFPGIQYRRQAVVCEYVGPNFEEDVIGCQQPQRTSWTQGVRT